MWSVQLSPDVQQLIQVIANYCSLPLFSFGHALGKLQGKVLTHSEKVGWWKTLMVECVSIFGNLDRPTQDLIWDYKLTRLHKYLKKLVLWDGFQEIYGSERGVGPGIACQMVICTVKSYIEVNRQKRLTHSTIKVFHQPTFSECVSTFIQGFNRRLKPCGIG